MSFSKIRAVVVRTLLPDQLWTEPVTHMEEVVEAMHTLIHRFLGDQGIRRDFLQGNFHLHVSVNFLFKTIVFHSHYAQKYKFG